jgi:transposase
MGRAGRPTVAIELTDEERETLVRWSRRHSSSQAPALRSRIALACADGSPNTKIADELGCDRVTVGKWRHRSAAERLEGLVDAPRPGAARTISDEVVEAVVVETLETTPKDATHWSTRSMAQRHGISRQTVSESGVPSGSSPGDKIGWPEWPLSRSWPPSAISGQRSNLHQLFVRIGEGEVLIGLSDHCQRRGWRYD